MKGIACNEYHEKGPKNQNKISFTFVDGDGEIPASCSVSLGDVDPMTGDQIMDVTFFREYHRTRNNEIYLNKKSVSVPLSFEQKQKRRALRARIAREFEDKYGYKPDKDTLEWLLCEKWPKIYRMEIDSFVNEEGESWADCIAEFADPAAEEAFRQVDEELDKQIELLHEYARKLTGRHREVFDLMMLEASGKSVQGLGLALAEKWGVTAACISMDKKRIGLRIRKYISERM